MSDKKARNRSPEHPAFDLPTAIERAQQLYDAEHFNYANKATAMAHWGYKSPKSSSGLRTLAALIHFGLLDEEGTKKDRRVRLSGRAKVILLREEGTRDRREAIKDAALQPRVYRELWEHLGNSGPLPSDRELRYKLETDWGFNPNAIDRFISDFRSTLEFANLLGNGLDWAEEGEESETAHTRRPSASVVGGDPGTPKRRERPMPSVEHDSQQVRDLTIPLVGGGMAVLSTPVPLSAENYDILETFLRTFKRSLTADRAGKSGDDEPTE